MLPVKRAIIFLLSASMLTACVGNVSLWGQYQTPTPNGGVPVLTTPILDDPAVEIFAQDQIGRAHV